MFKTIYILTETGYCYSDKWKNRYAFHSKVLMHEYMENIHRIDNIDPEYDMTYHEFDWIEVPSMNAFQLKEEIDSREATIREMTAERGEE